jgi:hypothetical protein
MTVYRNRNQDSSVSTVTKLARCLKVTAPKCMITGVAQNIDNGHTAQVNTLPAILHSITLYCILLNSDKDLGWRAYI